MQGDKTSVTMLLVIEDQQVIAHQEEGRHLTASSQSSEWIDIGNIYFMFHKMKNGIG